MKKQFLLFTAFLALATASFSQTNNYRVTEYVGNIPTADDVAVDMCKDSDGNMYAVGKVYNGSNMDISVSKFDNFGNLQWEQIYDNGGNDRPIKIEIGESSNIYVTGNSQVSGTNKGLVLKYNSMGNLQWDTHAGGISGTTVLNSKTMGVGGDTYLSGYYMSSATDQKAIVYKIGSDGAQDWAENYDYGAGDNEDEFSDVSINPYNGDVYCGGMANGSKILLVKYNSSGTQQWAKTPRNGKVLDLTSGGSSFSYNIYIAAQTSVSLPDAYTAKYNSNGDMSWEDSFTDGALTGAAEIHYYNSNIYVAYRHSAGSGSPDVNDFIKKYNTSGTEQWIINDWYVNLGTYSNWGEFGVSDYANILTFEGDYMYSLAENLSVNKFSLTDPLNDNLYFYPVSALFYDNLKQMPTEVLPVRSFVNNGMLFLLGDGKFEATDNSRIALSSYCEPVTTVSIDAPYNTCGNILSASANNVSSAKWDYRAENGGTFTSFSNINSLNTDVEVSFTNDMDIMLMVRGEDENTCPTYTNIIVNFHTNPTPVISGDLEFCEGLSTVLDAGSYSSYTWSNGDDTQTSTITAAGDFSVEVTDANGCMATSALVSVVQNSLPTVSLGADQDICQGENTILDAGTFDSYLWSDGSTMQTLTVTTTGDYILEVTDANSCSNSDTVHVEVTVCNGISNNVVNNINVYPNPAHNKLTINNEQLLINNAEILDITGKTVKQFNVNTKQYSVDISDLQNGVYFLKLQATDFSKTLKVVKK